MFRFVISCSHVYVGNQLTIRNLLAEGYRGWRVPLMPCGFCAGCACC